MEQKNRPMNESNKNDFNYSNSELEFLQLARDLATQYQEVYNDKKLELKDDSLESSTPQKSKK